MSVKFTKPFTSGINVVCVASKIPYKSRIEEANSSRHPIKVSISNGAVWHHFIHSENKWHKAAKSFGFPDVGHWALRGFFVFNGMCKDAVYTTVHFMGRFNWSWQWPKVSEEENEKPWTENQARYEGAPPKGEEGFVFTVRWEAWHWSRQMTRRLSGINVLSFLLHVHRQCACTNMSVPSNVYWTVHHCNSWRMKNQLDVTCYFISLIMRSTCFGH